MESGWQNFALKRGESPGMRFLMFRQWLAVMLGVNRPDVVVYEQAHHRGGAATEVGVGLTTRVQEECASRDIPYAAVHTATLKKWATGSGRASKQDMMARASEIAGRDIPSDDEADAICLLDYGLAMYGGKVLALDCGTKTGWAVGSQTTPNGEEAKP